MKENEKVSEIDAYKLRELMLAIRRKISKLIMGGATPRYIMLDKEALELLRKSEAFNKGYELKHDIHGYLWDIPVVLVDKQDVVSVGI